MIVHRRGIRSVSTSGCHVLGQGQYDEFAKQLDQLIAPLCAAAPHVLFRPYLPPFGRGRPGVFAFGAPVAGAKYQFALSILLRWRDSVILNVLEADDAEREITKANFASKVQGILDDIEVRYRVDWSGGSQESPQALAIELEEF